MSYEYPALQTYFNSCLKEWYSIKNTGKLYHYSPPGLLLTSARYKKTPPHVNKLAETNVWVNNNDKRLRILHIDPDRYSVKKIVSESFSNRLSQFHVVFTNSYHMQFISFIESVGLYNILSSDFVNLRLISGSYSAFHLIFYEQLFHYAFIYLNKRNCRGLLRLNVIRSLHSCMYPFRKILLLTDDPQISKVISDQVCRKPDTNPLSSQLNNLKDMFIPQSEAESHFKGVNLNGLSNLNNDTFYSLNNKIVVEDDLPIANYLSDMLGSTERNGILKNNRNIKQSFPYYRVDENLPNIRLKRPVSM